MSNLEEILMDQIEAERRERIAEGEAQKAPEELRDLKEAEDARQRSLRDALAKVQEESAARARNHAESKCMQILESIRVALEENEDPDEALEIVKEALGL